MKKARTLTSILSVFYALYFAGYAFAQAPQDDVSVEARKAIENLSHESSAQRAAAACALISLRTPLAIPLLVRQLGDETAAFAKRPCQTATDWTPRYENTMRTRAVSPASEAAIALAALSEIAVAPLISALTDSDPVVRKNAAWAIGEIRDGHKIDRGGAIEPLLTQLRKDESPEARKWAAWALGEICDRRAVSDLIDALDDNDGEVRAIAAEALGEIKDRRALDPLKRALKDSYRPVRRKGRIAIDEINEWLTLYGDRPVRQ